MPFTIARKCCLLLFLLTELAYGQHFSGFVPRYQLPDAVQQSGTQARQPENGSRISILTFRDGEQQVDAIDLAEPQRVIVEFKEPPLFMQRLGLTKNGMPAGAIDARFQQFAADLNRFQQSQPVRLRAQLAQPQIERRFHKVFFGVSLQATTAVLLRLHELDYVKRIHWDNKVQAHLDDSIALIRADSVWHTYGTQGDSVVVGILDTGIDYRHSALGGGFGPGFKVIGGHDLINNDADPMDDEGHGTFVAGIVAADGDSLKGVAPKALLMAFKVLDSNGTGFDSGIIAGIERAVDPNDDNDFADKVDVANMSLGGLGHPDDAVSTAVDNAVRLGITFCVSAGNTGDIFGFKSIGSPGAARLAITVGASDKTDRMAIFSSKGPNLRIYSIKPEIVAPGVDIRSLALQDGVRQASGTSATAPHVAGVCALLKALHPEYTPAQLKSALMSSAVDIGEEVMVQGAGRLDAWNAANTATFTDPAHVSFGLDDVTMPIWEKSEIVEVVNHSPIIQSYTVLADGVRAGIELQATPPNFSLAPADTQRLIISLAVNNDLVPYPVEGSLAYSGIIHLEGTSDRLPLPWAFVKAARVIVSTDLPFADFVLSSDKEVVINSVFHPEVRQIDPYNYEFTPSRGRYDMLTVFLGQDIRVVARENLVIEGFQHIRINSQEAIHQVELQGVDEGGRLISSLPNAQKNYVFLFPDSAKFYSYGLYRFTGEKLWVSSLSERFTLGTGEHQENLDGEASIRVVQHQPLTGISSGLQLANAPSDFVSQHLRIEYPPHGTYRDVVFSNTFAGTIHGDAVVVVNGIPTRRVRVPTPEWRGTLYHTPDVSGKYRLSTSGEAIDSENFFDNGVWLDMGTFAAVGDSIATYGFGLNPSQYRSPNGGEMLFGTAPIFGSAFFANNWLDQSSIAVLELEFHGALHEWRESDSRRARYTLYDESNHLIASGAWQKPLLFEVPAGSYTLEWTNRNYYVEGVRGAATLKNHFDLRRPDSDPAMLTSIRLLNAEKLQAPGRVATGEAARLRFSAADILRTEVNGSSLPKYQSIAADSTSLSIKPHGTSEWQSIELSRVLEDTTIGWLYSADLSHTTGFDSAAIDLKIHVQDQSGNVTELVLEPAYAVGRFGTVVSVDEPSGSKVPLTFKLYQNHPNPFNPTTEIAFDLPRRSHVTLRIYDLLGREVDKLIDHVLEAGRHQVRWDGLDERGQRVVSGVYVCRLIAGELVRTKKMLLVQ